MKTIEQKALAYDEAIKKIKYVMEHGVQPVLNKKDLQGIFPELKKSESEEDVRRKSTIQVLEYARSIPDYNQFGKDDIDKNIAWLEKQESVEEIVARCKKSWYNEGKIDGKFEGIADDVKYQQGWHDALEKQGEQKLTDKVKSKFHEGDWVVWNNKIYCHVDNIYQGKESLMYAITDTNNMIRTYSVKDFDRNAHLWTIQDAKDSDVLYSLDSNQPFIYKERNIHEQATAYCGINKYGKFFVWNTKDCIITLDKYIPATKFQRDTLLKAMADAGWTFDFEKKELKKIESNPAWSEEDDAYQSFAISAVEEYYDTKNSIQRGLIDWLKSLKGRVGCEANCTTTKELSESDEEEFQIAIDTLVEAGQRDSAHWLESLKERIGG